MTTVTLKLSKLMTSLMRMPKRKRLPSLCLYLRYSAGLLRNCLTTTRLYSTHVTRPLTTLRKTVSTTAYGVLTVTGLGKSSLISF